MHVASRQQNSQSLSENLICLKLPLYYSASLTWHLNSTPTRLTTTVRDGSALVTRLGAFVLSGCLPSRSPPRFHFPPFCVSDSHSEPSSPGGLRGDKKFSSRCACVRFPLHPPTHFSVARAAHTAPRSRYLSCSSRVSITTRISLFMLGNALCTSALRQPHF